MSPGSSQPAVGGSVRVLYVDDDEAFLDLAATYLERHGLDIVTAADADAGLAALDDHDVDCVVSDYDMPGADGLEFLEAVRAGYSELPFVLFTGKGDEGVASDAISAGVTDYLQKSTGTDQYALLANRVRNAVDRDRSKRALGEHDRQLRTLIQNLPGMAYRCRNDPDWTMEFVGGEVESLSGHTADAIESGAVVWGDDVIHPDDQDPIWDEVQAAVAAGDAFEVTYRIETADGDVRHVWERGRGVGETADGPLAIEGFITDITDRVERERELERRNDRLEEFASIVSHDLRSPLNVAEGYLEMTQETGDTSHLQAVVEAHDRMRTLIEDILTLAREGRTVTEFEAVDIADVATDCWSLVEAPGAALDVRTTETILADRSRLRQIFENLYRNAVEHAGDDVTITVGCLDGSGDDAGFYVEDDGVGIPAGKREQVFESGYTTGRDGTGFGLTIVAEIADAHGWRVELTESEGGGARFEVRGVEFA